MQKGIEWRRDRWMQSLIIWSFSNQHRIYELDYSTKENRTEMKVPSIFFLTPIMDGSEPRCTWRRTSWLCEQRSAATSSAGRPQEAWVELLPVREAAGDGVHFVLDTGGGNGKPTPVFNRKLHGRESGWLMGSKRVRQLKLRYACMPGRRYRY